LEQHLAGGRLAAAQGGRPGLHAHYHRNRVFAAGIEDHLGDRRAEQGGVLRARAAIDVTALDPGFCQHAYNVGAINCIWSE